MALLRWELKKIWRPGLLLAIALIGLVFYDARPGFYLEHFWNASNLRLSAGWLEAYGTTMEPEERAQLDGQLAELEAEFAQQVAEIPGAAEAGITDYESYLDWDAAHQNGLTEEEHQLGFAVYSNTNLNMVESLMEFMENYDTLAEGEEPEIWGGRVGEYSPAHQPSIRRVEEVRAAGVFGFLPSAAINSADNFFHYFAIWCVFSAVLLLSPTLVRDQLRRTRAMQWTSRRGRGVLNAQMGAALLSGVLLTLRRQKRVELYAAKKPRFTYEPGLAPILNDICGLLGDRGKVFFPILAK